MPIKLLIPKEPILRRIWEARPLLSLKQDMTFMGDMRDATQEGRASLAMAHRMYSLGLDSLLSEQGLALQPVGLRVYEMSEDKPQAFFDVSEEEQPRLLQMSASKNHLEPFARGLTEALNTVEQTDQECELRLFRVPALNFEALWINYEGETKDLLVPLRVVGQLTLYKAVPLDEALDALREAARPLAQMDKKMGA
jgi:hypothetical protein